MTTKIKSGGLNNNIITTSHLHTNFSVDSDKIAANAIGPSELNQAANYTFTGTVAGAGANPADRVYFHGGLATAFNGTRVTEVQITGMTANEIDSHNAFDGTTFTVPAGGDGRYILNFACGFNYDDIGDDGEVTYITTKVNGDRLGIVGVSHTSAGQMKYVTPQITSLADLTAGDAVTWWAYGHATSGNHQFLAGVRGSGKYPRTMVSGYKLL